MSVLFVGCANAFSECKALASCGGAKIDHHNRGRHSLGDTNHHCSTLPLAPLFFLLQLKETATKLLEQSSQGTLSSELFQEVADALSKLLDDVRRRDSSSQTKRNVRRLLQRLLVIIARPARLLDCLVRRHCWSNWCCCPLFVVFVFWGMQALFLL